MPEERCIRKTKGRRVCNKVKDMPFSITDGEKAAILEAMSEPVILVDTDLKVVWSNAAMNTLFNLTAEQLEGQHCFEKMHGLKRLCRICPVVKAINSGQPCIVDDFSSLGRRWMLRAYPLRDGEGNINRVVEIVADITESKQAEEALEKRIVALTRPLDDIENIAFEDLFKMSDLQRLQDMLADAWGVAVLLTRPDGTLITRPSNFTYFCSEFIRKNEKGFKNCQISDAALGRYNPSGPTIHRCLSAGLWGAGASVTIGGRHIANWLIGQVRNEAQSEKQIMEYAREIGADEAAFCEAFLKVPVMPQEKFEHIAHTLFALANQLSTIAYQNIQQARFIAERKQAEEALQSAKKWLEDVVEFMPDATLIADKDNKIIAWNRAAENMSGIPKAAIIGCDHHQATVGFYGEQRKYLMDLVFTDDEELAAKYSHVRRVGSTIYAESYVPAVYNNRGTYVLAAASPFYDTEGNLHGMIESIRDITEYKRVVEAIRESEEKFRGIYEASPIGIELYDREGTLLDVNKACLDIFGISDAKAVIDVKLFENPNLREKFKEQLRRGESVRHEMPYDFGTVTAHNLYETTKSGIIYLDVLITPLRGISKESNIGYIVHTRDITKWKQAEKALRESEARFRLVVESSPLAIGLANQDGQIDYVNPKFIEMFGDTTEDIPTVADWFRLAYPDPVYRESNLKRWQKALEEVAHKGGSTHGIEAKVTCKDGPVRIAEVFGTPMENKTLAIFNDITERSKLEVQMREVQKLESLGVLAGGIAHDFNNLLMAILGRADLALLSISPVSPAYQHVEEITRASQRAADLCRQMLAYSGKGQFVVSRHDISEIVREMGQMLDVSVSKNAMMRYSLAEGLPAVESDATQIRQVIMNLITNASDALGGIQGIITVTTGVMECDETYLSESYLDDSLPGGTYVTLEVSDTGCGIDAETRSRIFDPFFTTKFTGRGLGLAAVLGIVRGHKGAIKVYSEVGTGTTIKLLLPAVEWKPGERVKTVEQIPSLKGGGTILLVDDDPYVRGVASEMLAQLGFQVLTANNGREGLNVFQTHGNEIACVILDLTMPEMGGEEAFRELRKL